MISNFEGSLNTTAVSPGGTWLVEKDPSPAGTASLSLADYDANGTLEAHFRGANLTQWGADMSVGLSASLSNGKPTGVDASAYTGISFKLLGGSGNMANTIFVKLQNEDSVPACGLCVDGVTGKECYAGYQTTQVVQVGAWQNVALPFSRFQAATWGNHASTVVDPKQIFYLTIAVDVNQAFDLWIDDVQFYH
jgi:hypothetical protein